MEPLMLDEYNVLCSPHALDAFWCDRSRPSMPGGASPELILGIMPSSIIQHDPHDPHDAASMTGAVPPQAAQPTPSRVARTGIRDTLVRTAQRARRPASHRLPPVRLAPAAPPACPSPAPTSPRPSHELERLGRLRRLEHQRGAVSNTG